MNRKSRRQAAKQQHGGVDPDRAFAEALRLHRAGRLEQAETLYRRVLAAAPKHAQALQMLGVIAHRSEDFAAAAALLRKAVAADPGEASHHYNLAEALRAAGRFEAAETSYRDVLGIDPNSADAHFGLGNALYESGRTAAAVACYRQAVRLAPGDAEAHNNLGNALLDLGDTQAGIESYRTALKVRPDYAEAMANLGSARISLGDLEAALADFRRALAAQPGLAAAHVGMGRIAETRRQPAEAIACYGRAAAAEPDLAEAHLCQGRVLRGEGRLEEAARALGRAAELAPERADVRIELGRTQAARNLWVEAEAAFRGALGGDPDAVEALRGRGEALMELGRPGEAKAAFERIHAAHPEDASAIANIGSCLQQQGAFAAAADYHRRALAMDPELTASLFSLVNARQLDSDEDEIARIEVLAASEDLADDGRADLSFALGGLFERRGEYDRAFDRYRRANEIRDRTSAFDPAKWPRFVDRLIATFTAGAFAAGADFGTDSELPVFVLGMPRSGTSLVEQIVASHPRAAGAGELYEFQNMVAALPEAAGGGRPYPECVAGLSRDAAAGLAAGYLDRLRAIAPGKARVVDKMPVNFVHLGLIALLFPRARIVHCRRDPLDVCLSCYFQNFRSLDWSSNLANIAIFYRQYERLMAHWRAVAPGRFLEIRYERMIAEQAAESRRLIDFLDLPWDERCLAFHQTERTVRTSSLWQVRQPIYASSIGRWRNFEAHLGPLIAALEDFEATA